MSFVIRSFEECVQALQNSHPDRVLNSKEGARYDNVIAYTFGNFVWPNDPPITTLYLQEDPANYAEGMWDFQDPALYVDYGNFEAVGIWNANGEAAWFHSPGEWIVIDATLIQEQDEWEEYPVDLLYAAWRVEEGFAYGIFDASDRATLHKVMGVSSFGSSRGRITIWHGE